MSTGNLEQYIWDNDSEYLLKRMPKSTDDDKPYFIDKMLCLFNVKVIKYYMMLKLLNKITKE